MTSNLSLCFILACVQEPSDEIRRLLEALRSTSIEEREAATEKLVALGDVARPHVAALEKDTDPEVGPRAVEIVRRIDHSLRIRTLVRSGAIPECLILKDPDLVDKIISDRPEDRREAFARTTDLPDETAEDGPRILPTFSKPKYLLSPRFYLRLQQEFRLEIESMLLGKREFLVDSPTLRSILLEWLTGKDPRRRKEAAAACTIHRIEKALPLLSGLLDDSDPSTVAFAAEALGSAGAAEFGDRLVPLLKHRHGGVRHKAFGALKSMERRDLAPSLVRIACEDASLRWDAVAVLNMWNFDDEQFWTRMLRDGGGGVRCHAVRGLGRASTPQSIDAIVRTLEDPSEDARGIEEAAASLVRRRAFASVEAIERALEQSYPSHTESHLVYCIRDLAGEDAETRFQRLLAHSSPDVRSAALESIGSLRLQGVVADVVKELQSAPSIAAAIALLRLDYRDAAFLRTLLPKIDGATKKLVARKIVQIENDLQRALADADPEVRSAALSMAAQERSMPKDLAISALGDSSPEVRSMAAWTIRRMGWRDAGGAIREQLGVETERLCRLELLRAANELRLAECRDEARKLWSDPGARDEAILASAAIDPAGTRAELGPHLEDPTTCVLLALGEVGDQEFLPFLRELVALQGRGPQGLPAAEAIVSIECRQDASRLDGLLQDEDEAIRRAAVRYARRIEAPRALLLGRLRDASADVADEALQALVETGNTSKEVLERVRVDLRSRQRLPLSCLNALIDPDRAEKILLLEDRPTTFSAPDPDEVQKVLLALEDIDFRVGSLCAKRSPWSDALSYHDSCCLVPILEAGFVRLEDSEEARRFWIDWIDRALRE